MKQKKYVIFLIGYFLLLSYWMLFGFGRSVGTDYMYNLKPFLTIKYFSNINRFNADIWIINLIGNIGVFIPFGFLIPMTFKSSYFKSLSIFFIGLTFLEVTQLITKRGSFDVDDFILNSLGFTLGYVAFKIVVKWEKSRRDNFLS